MKFLKYLQEEYISGTYPYTTGSSAVEIFEFPDKKELRNIHDVRWLVDYKKRKFYVWDANSKVTHWDVQQHFNINDVNCISGLSLYSVDKHKFTFPSMEIKHSNDDYKFYTFGDVKSLVDKFKKATGFYNEVLKYFYKTEFIKKMEEV
jgi:hypothetical protein